MWDGSIGTKLCEAEIEVREVTAERPTGEQVAAEWERIERERETVLTWARGKEGRRQDVVQTYRFERRQGAYSSTAHTVASKTVAKLPSHAEF